MRPCGFASGGGRRSACGASVRKAVGEQRGVGRLGQRRHRLAPPVIAPRAATSAAAPDPDHRQRADMRGGVGGRQRDERVDRGEGMGGEALHEHLAMPAVSTTAQHIQRRIVGEAARRDQRRSTNSRCTGTPQPSPRPIARGEADADAGEAARPAIDQDRVGATPPASASSAAIIGTSRSAWPRPTSSRAAWRTSPASISATEQAAVAVSMTSSIRHAVR